MGPELVYSLIVAPAGAWTAVQGSAFAALIVAVALLATARPLLVLVVLFGGPALELLGIDELTIFVIAGLLVFGEHQLRATEWTELFPIAFELQGVVGIAMTWLGLVLGTSPAGVVVDGGTPLRAVALVGGLGIAVILHALVYRARSRVWRLLRDVGVAWVATFGETLVVGGLALVVLVAPFAAVVAALGFALPLLAVALGIQAVNRWVDARFRHPCPLCGRPVRLEAHRCPHCGGAIAIRRPLT